MGHPIFLMDWTPPDPSDEEDDWFERIEDPYPFNDPYSIAEQLRVAIESNSINRIQELLFNHAASDLEDALFVAIRWGSVEIVRMLLSASTDPNLCGDAGCRPLMMAAQKGHLTIVQDLINAGAIIDAEDEDGATALSRAAYAGQIEIVEYMLSFASQEERENADWYRKLVCERSNE